MTGYKAESSRIIIIIIVFFHFLVSASNVRQRHCTCDSTVAYAASSVTLPCSSSDSNVEAAPKTISSAILIVRFWCYMVHTSSSRDSVSVVVRHVRLSRQKSNELATRSQTFDRSTLSNSTLSLVCTGHHTSHSQAVKVCWNVWMWPTNSAILTRNNTGV